MLSTRAEAILQRVSTRRVLVNFIFIPYHQRGYWTPPLRPLVLVPKGNAAPQRLMNLTLVNKLSRIVHNNFSPAAGAVSLALLLSLGGSPAYGEDSANGKIHHVLLISLDGMHSLDMANYIKGHPQSALAQLAASGVNYTAASTTKPSDSFPSMVGIVTGGTPAVTGIYYDDAYNRALSPPGSNCTTVGTAIDLKEGIDINPAARGRRWRYRPGQTAAGSEKGMLPGLPA